jgi:2-oxoglutarate dehydrogenase E1 component
MERKNIGNEAPWHSFFGPNLGYVMEWYDQYQEDPESIDPEVKAFFDEWGTPPSLNKSSSQNEGVGVDYTDPAQIEKIATAVKLATYVRTYGHLYASIFPLEKNKTEMALLKLENFNLTEEDVKRIPPHVLCPNAPDHIKQKDGLAAYHYLIEVYTKKIAFEYQHVHNREENAWLKEMIESGKIYRSLSADKKKSVLKRLTQVEGFEQFLHRSFVGQKRFSIEGVDMLVPLLDEVVEHAVHNLTKSINIGMAHRGRLNVLAHVLGKPYELIFSEFQHAPNKEVVPSEGSIGISYGWSGDVKYHLGADKHISEQDQSFKTRLTLANNPSHLEYVNPVVEGYTRAVQDDRTGAGYPSVDSTASLAVLIHGDAAFPGEGIVAETLNLSGLNGYHTGGTIHVIANNKIGFTTESVDSRSTKYASDLAKGFEMPIIHVNADDPEACLAAAYLAFEYRKKFKKDFIIDLIGYRRFGHNEMDEPSATQPKTYELVRAHKTVKTLYAEQLQKEGVVTEEDVKAINEKIEDRLQEAFSKTPDKKSFQPQEVPEMPERQLPPIETAVDGEQLLALNDQLVKWPEGFSVFKKLQKILEKRATNLKDNGKVDWSLGEALAFATILKDGTPIRLTGQDSERGTFAHRHIVLHDEKTGDVYSPLHTLEDVNVSFAVHNSPLTEAAVVGFEYGYNVFAPETLVIWEAQFGDFANAAQVIFDQFITAGQAKWGQKSGLVMLLPHGYEGQGPEHSSARLERFLQLAAENNWDIANVTTASQYYHILRRQAALLKHDDIRPLVIMTPKSLLRNAHSVSYLDDLSKGEFKQILQEETTGKQKEKVERIIMCSGKVAIDLRDTVQKQEEEIDSVHILRVEELYPFPLAQAREILAQYPNLKELVWVQEEPKNMGPWSYAYPRLQEIVPEGVEIGYVGRRRRSSPSEGDPTVHKKEQERIVNEALKLTNHVLRR